ncbi:MAG: LEA type 2 family protein [Spirochaetota bacterium]|jgi:hypothetical protein|nr:LEA type 2 family protein [Spirochaetota bacterium]
MKDLLIALRKPPGCAFFTFLTDIIFFVAAAILVEKVLHYYLFDRVIYTIFGDLVNLVPSSLRARGENSLLDMCRPLMLYLAWQFALNFATIFTGLFNTKLSAAIENALLLRQDAEHRLPERSASAAFGLSQDLLMLACNILWTAMLFLLPQYGIIPRGLAEFAFWVFTPFIYALYNLSYAALPRGVSYAHIFRIAWKRPAQFMLFVYTSSIGPFLLLFLLSRIDWAGAAFLILFGVSALFRSFGVVMGTDFAFRLAPHFNLKNVIQPMPAFAVKCTIFALAICVVTVGVQVAAQTDSKLKLLNCRYRILDADLDLPRIDSGSIFEQILGVVSFAAKPSAHLDLEITNPEKRAIFVENMDIGICLHDREIAVAEVQGFTLNAGTSIRRSVSARLDTENIGRSILQLLAGGGDLPFEFRAKVLLNTWLGEIPYTLRITPE